MIKLNDILDKAFRDLRFKTISLINIQEVKVFDLKEKEI